MIDDTLLAQEADAPLNARALSKLRWRCRRGLLENDLFIERFFASHEQVMTVGLARGMYGLMDLSDNDLLDLLLGRKGLSAETTTTFDAQEMQHTLALLMQSRQASSAV
jgi:antitoxin CptB